jgi:hypothetical protein
MKTVKLVLLLVFFGASLMAFSETTLVSDSFSSSVLDKWTVVSGSWRAMNGRLYQTDTSEKMAMITLPVNQSGKILYEFDVRYVAGGEDNYAGFGIHFCITNPSKVRSWGMGQSFLAWLTWDPDTYGYPGGFAQVYESFAPTRMGLFPEGDIVEDGDQFPIMVDYLDMEFLSYTITVRIELDTRTGKGYLYDPFDPYKYRYPFDMGQPINAGSYFGFRTNSLAVSLDNFRVAQR